MHLDSEGGEIVHGKAGINATEGLNSLKPFLFSSWLLKVEKSFQTSLDLHRG